MHYSFSPAGVLMAVVSTSKAAVLVLVLYTGMHGESQC